MEVTETLNEGLKREFKIIVPATVLEENLMNKLGELAATASIPGFRPGKVPVSHLKKVHGQAAMAEVIQKTIEDTTSAAISERELRPAYQPDIVLSDDQEEVNAIIAGKADLAYDVKFEIIPDFEIKDFDVTGMEKLVIQVEDKQVEESIQKLAEQHKDYYGEEKGSKSEEGDQLTISFVGRINGEKFDGGSAEEVPLVLGSGGFIPGFEEQLTGASAGDVVTVKVTFPEDYQQKELAGKPAEFETTVLKVSSPKEVEINDAFAEGLGVENMEKLDENIRTSIAAEFEQMTNAKLKRDVLDKLHKMYDFDLPERLVDEEYNQIWSALAREMTQEGRSFEDEGTTEEEESKNYRDIASRRVRLGLVLGKIGEKAKVSIEEQELQDALISRVREFPGQEQQVYEFYTKNPDAMMELRGPIFEQKVIDYILKDLDIPEKTVTAEEFTKIFEADDDADKKPAKKKAAKKAAKKPAKKKAAKKAAKKAEKE